MNIRIGAALLLALAGCTGDYDRNDRITPDAGAEVDPIPAPPAAPTGLQLNPEGSDLGPLMSIRFDQNEGASYNAYWSLSPGAGTDGNLIENISSGFEHEGIEDGATYYYVVTAVADGQESEPSEEVSATAFTRVRTLGLPSGLELCALRMDVWVHGVTHLDCGIEIDDLSGVEQLSAVRELRLAGSPVEDLTPIVGLSELRFLAVRFTGTITLPPLASMPSLTSIHLGEIRLTTLAPFANAVQLAFLTIDDVPLPDISPLSSLTGLDYLRLLDTDVEDVSPLAALVPINELIVIGRPVRFGLSTLVTLTNASRIVIPSFAPEACDDFGILQAALGPDVVRSPPTNICGE